MAGFVHYDTTTNSNYDFPNSTNKEQTFYSADSYISNGDGTVTLSNPTTHTLYYGRDYYYDVPAGKFVAQSVTASSIYRNTDSGVATRVNFASGMSGENDVYWFRVSPFNGATVTRFFNFRDASEELHLTVPGLVMQGKQVTISWTAVTDATNYTVQRKASADDDWEQVYNGSDLTFTETVGTWTSLKYRVCAVSGSLTSEWVESGDIEVVTASAIAISGTDGDIGTLTSDVSYTVSSSGTSELTVVETINGTSRTFTAVNGATNKISVVDLATGYGTISIQASTNPGSGVVSVTREWTYTKTAPVFPDSGSVADLTQQGKTIWAKTIAEAVRTSGIWGGNLGLALGKLARSVLYNPNQVAKYSEVTVSLSGKSEGDIISLPENGKMVEFYVAKLDYESGLNGTGRVLMVRKDCYDNRAWDSGDVNAYATSDIDSWFNGDYKSMFPQEIQTAMGTTEFYYTPGNGNYTVGTLERAVFALSAPELGKTSVALNEEGTVLPISDQLQISYFNGKPNTQWTRSPNIQSTNGTFYLDSSGSLENNGCTYSYGARPCFTLPSTFEATFYVDQLGTIHDAQEYAPIGFTDVMGGTIPMVSIKTGSYVGTGTSGSSNPNTLNFDIQPLLLIIFPYNSGTGTSLADATYSLFIKQPNSYYIWVDTSAKSEDYACYVTFQGNKVSWYSRDVSFQRNSKGDQYYYFAVGLAGGDNE